MDSRKDRRMREDAIKINHLRSVALGYLLGRLGGFWL